MFNGVNFRRSIRAFKDRKIDRTIIDEICRSGLQAPSARNSRPWELIAVDDESRIKDISDMRKPWVCLAKAAAAIVVCARKDKYFEQNCAALAENILISATDHGIGSVWLGLYPHKDVADRLGELLDCPEDVIPFCVIALGYPESEDVFYERIVENAKIHWQKW